MNLFFKKARTIGGLGVLFLVATGAVLASAGFVLWLEETPGRNEHVPDVAVQTKRILQKCASASYRPGCYDREIPELMNFMSMEEVFKVTQGVQKNDGSYWYCHVLSHKLSGRETAKDSSKWKDVAARCPTGMCSNGCIHGAFQERFRSEQVSDSELEALKTEFRSVCEPRQGWNPTHMEISACHHALGHLLMYVSDADINKSVSMCGSVSIHSSSDFSSPCFDGAFMQLFQPLEADDISLVEGKQPTKDGVFDFCSRFTGEARASCWGESWPLYGEEIKSAKGTMEFCSKFSEDRVRDRCYDGVFFITASHFGLDNKRIQSFCEAFPHDLQGTCFSLSAARFIETDKYLSKKAVDLCAVAKEEDTREECFEKLYSTGVYSIHKNDPNFKRLCDVLPQQLKEDCYGQMTVPSE